MQLGSMFICNCNMLALYLATCHSPEAASTVSKCSWRWT